MRVVKLSTMDRGGAARAALRLQQGLRDLGVDSRMLVQTRSGDAACVYGPRHAFPASLAAGMRLFLDQFPVMVGRRKPRDVFAPAWLPGNVARRVNRLHADIIHLHWITKAFVSIEELSRLNAPLVWTLHDMWPFSGGCHYDSGCGRFAEECGACPVLGSKRGNDLSRRVVARKRRAWDGLDLTIVCPSRWLAECARSSSLFHDLRIELIPNGINTGIFRPRDKAAARASMGLAADLPLLLFGSMDATANRRKGYRQLQSALQVMARHGWVGKVQLVVFGAKGGAGQELCGFPVHFVGHTNSDELLADMYSAADVFVAPSQQDNLPNTVLEALACGTPCVAFRIGGMPDMIDHRANGYLAEPQDVADLARGMAWVLEDRVRWERLSAQSRATVEKEFELKAIAGRYQALYSEILSRGTGRV